MSLSNRRVNNNFDKANLDKRVDRFLEVGRQFVDGVAGNRPGSRKKTKLDTFSRRNIRNMSNWVENKMDDFFDNQDDDWGQNSEYESDNKYKYFNRDENQIKDFNSQAKRPLEAISLRISEGKVFQTQKMLSGKVDSKNEEDWEDNSYFQTNRWKRSASSGQDTKSTHEGVKITKNKTRILPRSRRIRT